MGWSHLHGATYPGIDRGNVTEQLEIAGHEIVAVHIKDTLAPCRGFAGQFKGVPFGTGCVDFPAVFRKLEEIDFRGSYMLEMWHVPGTNANSAIASALAFVREQYEKGALA